MHAVAVPREGADRAMEIMVVILLYLFICSCIDIRTRELPVCLIGTGLLLSVVLFIIQVCAQNRQWTDVFFAVLPGGMLVLLSFQKNKMIGTADGLIFIMTGLCYSIDKNLMLLIGSFLLAGLSGCIFLLVRKESMKKIKLAFVPFIFAASVIVETIAITNV